MLVYQRVRVPQIVADLWNLKKNNEYLRVNWDKPRIEMDKSLVKTGHWIPLWNGEVIMTWVLGKKKTWSICGSPHNMNISAGYGCILHDCFLFIAKDSKIQPTIQGWIHESLY